MSKGKLFFMKQFLENLKAKARQNPKRIVFPESLDYRILKACEIVIKEKTCKPILLGKIDEIRKFAKKERIKLSFERIEVIDPDNLSLLRECAHEFFILRKHKGISEEESLRCMTKINYFSIMLVQIKKADAMIAGATWTTAETVKPALQIIKTKRKFHKVSGFFFMLFRKKLLIFADCAITIDPNSYDLAHIAIDTALTAKSFNIEPRIAMLSYSTNHSGGDHPSVEKIREATAIAKDLRPDLLIEGEIQVDAALDSIICERKFPDSKIHGSANVLIFPNLDSANIAYKLVERLGGYTALGPILQGLRRPINDLSRGCTYKDIVNMAAITTIEAQKRDFI